MNSAASGDRGRLAAWVVLPAVALGIGFATFSAHEPGPAVALVRADGPLPIVVRVDAIPAERTAAAELAEHLRLVTGRRFPVVAEDAVRSARPAIHVGATRFARGRGIPCEEQGPEGWIVTTAGPQAVLCGGRPRGTLYAVYRFLEDELGVRWWTPFERDVPTQDVPRLGPGPRTGAPVFAYRDMNGVVGPRVFGARSRLNGHFTGLRSAHGGSERFGPPSQVHNFFRYVPPEEFFAAEPELFSEIAGLRWADETQLCLTHERVFAVVFERLERYVAAAQRRAARAGVEPPRLYDVSQNDWGRPCDCERCTRENAAAGSRAGPLIAFANRLAEAITRRYPDVWVDTLAYGWSFDPPSAGEVHERVIVRVAPLYARDFAQSLDAPAHASIRAAFQGWSAIAAHLRVWDYIVTYGDEGDLPLPTLDRVATDLRRYREYGVEGVFMQQDPAVAADMLDLKRWVVIRLLENPERDPAELVRTFTDGYYGQAGEAIRRYREAVARSVADHGAPIAFDAPASAFEHLDRDLVIEAQALFDEAEARIAGDATLERRVRHARLMLDAATLGRWDALFGESLEREPPFERQGIVERWERTYLEQIEIRLAPGDREEARQEVLQQQREWSD